MAAKKLSVVNQTPVRPDIYEYLDYRLFLKDWFAYQARRKKNYSMQDIAKLAGITPAYFSMILNGKRVLTETSFQKLEPHLGLSQAEVSYLKNLIQFADSKVHEQKHDALQKLRRSSTFRSQNQGEVKVFQYFAHWFIAAIRELAVLPEFKPDAKWIQSKLKKNVELSKIRKALDFLEENKLMPTDEDPDFSCTIPVFKVAMAQYHFEMLSLAATAIEDTPKEKRNILGHTFALDEKQIPEAKKILDEALEKIVELEKSSEQKDVIYQTELALFPLTNGETK